MRHGTLVDRSCTLQRTCSIHVEASGTSCIMIMRTRQNQPCPDPEPVSARGGAAARARGRCGAAAGGGGPGASAGAQRRAGGGTAAPPAAGARQRLQPRHHHHPRQPALRTGLCCVVHHRYVQCGILTFCGIKILNLSLHEAEQQRVREAAAERQREVEGRERLRALNAAQEEVLQLHQLLEPANAFNHATIITRGNQLCAQVSAVLYATEEMRP
ncbi:uncharacterized protein LOC134455956 isoform X3 [Engraulis encrasicolus]|uniref:uncharacterized protein LOC134455956 isoform X3 n=1 Tax=Engraulis encrasicolus TaxID=184585 RepID=UPI002FD2062F